MRASVSGGGQQDLLIEERHGSVVGLSEHEAQTWIDEAKAFQE